MNTSPPMELNRDRETPKLASCTSCLYLDTRKKGYKML